MAPRHLHKPEEISAHASKFMRHTHILHVFFFCVVELANQPKTEMEATDAIRKAASEGKLNKRQATALVRLSERVSQPTIEHMLGLMGHVTLAKALRDAKEKGL